jgi:transcriptional regulator with XRE-family HTH domain
MTHVSSTPSTGHDPQPSFPALLRAWRTRRHLSQLELALASGVSQRHLSFLEKGRSRPSRTMILQLSEALQVPLRERNALLLSAGFAPMFRARSLDDPQMAQVLAAVHMMLANHAPFPAIAIDRCWNIRMANAPFEQLATMLGRDLWTRIGGTERNLMALFFHPYGLKPLIANWAAIAPFLWHRARREAELVGGEDMRAMLDQLSAFQSADTLWAGEETTLLPVLPVDLVKDGVRISLFTVISTFGTAQDATADELRIESFFPADTGTEQLFRQLEAGLSG